MGVPAIPRDLRSLVALAFANSAADAALIPLLPGIRDDLALSGAQTGAVVSAATLTMLAVAIPIGLVAGRVATRTLLVVAAMLLPLSLAAAALAPGLPVLLGARALFGLSFALLWVVGPGRAAASGRGAAGTGVLVAAAGAGWLVAPVLVGLTADVAGWRAPLLGLAALTLPLGAALACDRDRAPSPHPVRLGDALALVRTDRAAAGAVAASAVLGVVTGVTSVLAPLALAGNGLSAGGIGAVFGVAALLWTVTAACAARVASRAVDTRLVAVAVAALAATWLLPAASLSLAAVVAFVVVSAACRSAANTFTFALGVGAARSDAAAAVVGVMNVAWALTALAAPLAAGAVTGDQGVRLLCGAVALLMLAVAAWLWARQRPAAAAVVAG